VSRATTFVITRSPSRSNHRAVFVCLVYRLEGLKTRANDRRAKAEFGSKAGRVLIETDIG
jgi:hypothetical protein